MKRKPIERKDLIGMPMYGIKVQNAWQRIWSNPNHKDIFGHTIISFCGSCLKTGEFKRFDVDFTVNPPKKL